MDVDDRPVEEERGAETAPGFNGAKEDSPKEAQAVASTATASGDTAEAPARGSQGEAKADPVDGSCSGASSPLKAEASQEKRDASQEKAEASQEKAEASQEKADVKGEQSEKAAAATAAAASAAQFSGVFFDAEDVGLKLKRLFSAWEQAEPWKELDCLCVFVGKTVSEEEFEGDAERFQTWLTGFQFLDSLFVFTRKSRRWLVVTSPKKAQHLQQLKAFPELRILERGDAARDAEVLSLAREEICASVGEEAKAAEVKVGSLWGGTLSDGQPFALMVKDLIKGFSLRDDEAVAAPLSALLAAHTPAEVSFIQRASRVAVAMMRTQLVSRVETVLDAAQKETHKAIAARAELLLRDQKQLHKLREKANVDPSEVEILFKNIQSGRRFELKASAEANDECLSQTQGTIVISLGCRYREFCAAICRTFLLNGNKEQKSTYAAALQLQQHVINSIKQGDSFAAVYQRAVEYFQNNHPRLVPHLLKNVGHATGALYRDPALVFNQKNEKSVIEANMTFVVAVALNDLKTADGKEYAIWIADTVLLKEDGSKQILTEGLSSEPAYVNYELDEGEEQPADSPPQKSKKKDGAAEAAQDKKKKKAKDGPPEKSSGGGSAVISASVLKNAESLILKDRLRRRDTNTGAQLEANEERDSRQAELRRKKLQALKQRFANEDTEGGGSESKERRQKRMADLKSFASPSDFPRDLRPGKLLVDLQSECLFVPFHGHHVPFHLSTVKNVTCSEGEQNFEAAVAAGAAGAAKRFCVLRINFQVPGSQTLTLKGEENPLPDLTGKAQLFVKELMFRSEDSKHLQGVSRTIKEQLKRVKQKAAEDLQYPGELANQEKLVLNRSGRRVLLKDLMVRPNISTGMRKLIGTLEAHSNGLRFTVNTRGQMDMVDITYANIKHAILQPCERDLIVLIHFHLKAPIIVGKKRTRDVQFYTEAGTQTDDLDNRRNRSYHDPDETLDEMREREMKKRLNAEFKRFVQQVEEISKVEFDLPYRELRFSGVPLKSNVEILPTANCLVHLVEWPPFLLPLEDIELVSFERVAHGLRNFDMIFVFQDYNKPVERIDLIPIEYLDNLKRWLNELEIVWYEGKQNLHWAAILKEIRQDPKGFVEDGGFDMFLGDANESGEEGDDSEDEDDEEYQEESSSDEDAKEGGAEGESEDGEASNSDSDYSSSEGSSLADESEDEEADDSDFDEEEEEGLSWDELEERAKKEDRKRGRDDDSEEDQRRTQKKRK